MTKYTVEYKTYGFWEEASSHRKMPLALKAAYRLKRGGDDIKVRITEKTIVHL